MRRLRVLFAVTVLVQLIVPTPARAWWEVIEQLSGPKLSGPHIEGRLICFMQDRTVDEQAKIDRVRPGGQQKGFTGVGVFVPCAFKVGRGDRRRASIDLGIRFLKDRDPEWTEGEDIRFVSLEPTVTWSPIRNPDRDILDLGFGAGAYWFMSDAFSGFNGAFVEPIRVDLHLPTTIRAFSKWMFVVPTVRAGVLVFPKGFEANAFARPGLTSPRIGGEAAKYVGFFFDLESLYN